MSSKDVWRWLLPKFSNEVLVQIYTEKEITFKSVGLIKLSLSLIKQIEICLFQTCLTQRIIQN